MSAPPSPLPPVLGLTDIAARWGRSREFVRLHMRDASDFPAPAGAINGGRNRFWLASDLDAYERRVPSVRAGASPRRASGQRAAQPERSEARSAPPPEPRPAPPSVSPDLSRSLQQSAERAEKKLSPDMQAALERMAQRERAKREGRTPSAFLLAFAFDQKPSFAFRERLKKQGWTFDPKTREWFARVRPKDVDAWRADFTEAGARAVYDEPQFD